MSFWLKKGHDNFSNDALSHLSFPLVGNLSSDSEQVRRILDKPE
jgi:hypothetical protein